MSIPALLPARRTFQLRLHRPPTRWGALAASLAITALVAWLMGTALFGRRILPWEVTDGSTHRAPEAITYVDVAPPLPEPASPAVAAPASPGGVAAPVPSAAPALPAPRTRGGVPPVAPPRDTAAGAAGRAPGRAGLPPRVPPAELPGAPTLPVVPRVEREPAATCAAPCAGGLSTGARVPAPVMDSAARAERLREIGESVPALARKRPKGDVVGAPGGPPADRTRPQPQGGVSIPIPLPGGGPSAAERRRNRQLDSAITGSLARVRARLDSIRADSIRKADSVRKARARPPER